MTAETLCLLALLSTLLSGGLCQETPTQEAATNDSCSTLQTDQCGSNLYRFFIDPRLMPATQEELDSECSKLNAGADCADNYCDNCPQVIRKDVADHFRKSTRLAVEDVCKADGAQLGKKLIQHGKCLKEKVHEGYNCVSDFVEHCEASTLLEPPSLRMPTACCAFLTFDRCFHNHTVSKCGSAAARPARAIVQGFAIFMVDKCLPYLSQPEKCDLSVLNGVLPPPQERRKVKSMLPALVEIVSVTFK